MYYLLIIDYQIYLIVTVIQIKIFLICSMCTFIIIIINQLETNNIIETYKESLFEFYNTVDFFFILHNKLG